MPFPLSVDTFITQLASREADSILMKLHPWRISPGYCAESKADSSHDWWANRILIQLFSHHPVAISACQPSVFGNLLYWEQWGTIFHQADSSVLLIIFQIAFFKILFSWFPLNKPTVIWYILNKTFNHFLYSLNSNQNNEYHMGGGGLYTYFKATSLTLLFQQFIYKVKWKKETLNNIVDWYLKFA